MRKIRKLIVHGSDQAKRYPGIAWEEEFVTAEDIKKFHVEHHRWSDIGYHWVIKEDGVIEAGRPESIAGAHVRGHNKDSLGICLITQDRSCRVAVPALVNLRRLIKWKLKEHELVIDDVYTHNFFDDKKTCPGFKRRQLLDLLDS